MKHWRDYMSEAKRLRAWLNGEVLPVDRLAISPFDRGLMYGDGLFETLRADDGHIWHYTRHIDRMLESARELNFDAEAFPDWRAIILNLIEANGLRRFTRIKILVTRGVDPTLGLPLPLTQTMLVTTTPFSPPSNADLERGVDARISNSWITPQLAAHKTMNYLPFLCANQEVKAQGAEIALLKDAEGFISEAVTAAVVFTRGEKWIFPKSQWQLPSTTAEVLAERLEADGHSIEFSGIRESDLRQLDGCWLLSSSMGARPLNLPGLLQCDGNRLERTLEINALIYS